MKFWRKPIFTGFAPNLKRQAVSTACAFLFFPWRWPFLRSGAFTRQAEAWLKNYFQVQEAVCFDSGRTALYFALKSLGVREGDEVLVQSYTCLVVINAIKFTGAKPIYVDVGDDFNLDSHDLIKKITPRSKALIIQHTFGKPAEIKTLLTIASEHNLCTIEDCAHSFGAKFEGKLTGTFTDIGMLSFGSDKVVSCGRGGALITNRPELGEKIRKWQASLPLSTRVKTVQHLWHFAFFYCCKPCYNLGVGKWLLALAKKLNIYNKIIYSEEKLGLPVSFYPSKLPNALAKILLSQFKNLEAVIFHQQTIARHYHEHIVNPAVAKPAWSENSIWLRYTVTVRNPQKLHARAKKNGVILGNWYDTPVAPKDADLNVFDYLPGMCPNDEKLAGRSVNLPTDRQISLRDAGRIVNIVNQYAD